MPIFEEQRKEKIQDMTGSASAVLRFIDGLLRSNVQDISIVVGSSSPPSIAANDLLLLPGVGVSELLLGRGAGGHLHPALALRRSPSHSV